MTFGFLVEIVAGAVFAALVIYLYVRFTGGRSPRKFFAATLVGAAAVYVGFAAIGLLSGDANTTWLLIELGGLLIYSVVAYFGFRKAAGLLAFGWAAHVFWDVLLHWGEKAAFVPGFYPNVCIGFDLIFAGYIVYRFFVVKKN